MNYLCLVYFNGFIFDTDAVGVRGSVVKAGYRTTNVSAFGVIRTFGIKKLPNGLCYQSFN